MKPRVSKLTDDEKARWATSNNGRRRTRSRELMEALLPGQKVNVANYAEWKAGNTAVKNMNKQYPNRKYGSIREDGKYWLFRLK